MLTEAQIERMRATADAALPDSMTLKGKEFGEGRASGGSESFATGPTVPCRASPLQAQEAAEMGVEWTEGMLALTFALSVPLTTSHRVVLRGVEYEVEAVMDARRWQISGRAVVVRVRQERPT
ncbi:MAG: hypothetical protein ACO1SV_12285 [Fimbriimonas sp.]